MSIFSPRREKRSPLAFFYNRQDRLLVLIISIIAYLLAINFEIYERLDAWFHEVPILEVLQIDELFVVAFVLSFALVIVSWRRYREIQLADTRFHMFFNEAPIGMSIQDLTGRFLYVNPALCQTLGYTEAELQTIGFRELTYSDDIEPGDELQRLLLKRERTSVQLEKRYIHKQGHLVWGAVNVSLVHSPKGEPLYYISQMQDITQRKLDQERLLYSQAQLAEAQSIARVGSWETDLIHHKLMWSDEQYRIFGIDPTNNEATYLKYIERIHPADRERAAHNIARAVQTGQSYTLEYRVIWPTGDIRIVQAKGKVVHDQAAKPVRLIGTVQDITEAKQTEETIRRLAIIVETSQDAILSVDQQGAIVTWNAGAERLYGYRADEAIGQPWTLLVPPHALTVSSQIFNQLLQGIEIGQREGYAIHRDGRITPVSVTTAPLRDDNGQVTGTAAIMRDISRSKLVEAELNAALKAQQTANEDLQRISRAKSDFVAMVSHEFRNVLATIRTHSELMTLLDLPAETMREYAEQISIDTDTLTRLITDLLDLNQIESGQMKLHAHPLDLNSLLRDMAETTHRKSALHSFDLRLDAGLPPIAGDLDKLIVAIGNLFDNAVKYSPDGGPIIVTSRTEDRVAHVIIQDFGLGIPGKDLERIFDRFARAEREATRYIWGTGLGLPIAQQIVHLHGGRIWAESIEGQGSIFHITLPLATTPTEMTPVASPQSA